MNLGFVYVIQAIGTNRIKIGFSAEPDKRLADLQTSSPFPLALIGVRQAPASLERYMHNQLKDYRCVGEWFEFDPQEAFSLLLEAAKEKELSIYDAPSICRGMMSRASALAQHAEDAGHPQLAAGIRGIGDDAKKMLDAIVASTDRLLEMGAQ